MTFQPEIVSGDPLFELIKRLVVEFKPKSILEIGSANGLGSTQAFITGITEAKIGKKCKLFCIEPNPERFADLEENVAGLKFVNCINAFSVPVGKAMTDEDIDDFMAINRGYNVHRLYSAETVKDWLHAELDMVERGPISQDGISQAMSKNKGAFDMVLIDGSAFTATAELIELHGSPIVIMDDTLDIKCHEAMTLLSGDDAYCLIEEGREYRNGYAAFKRAAR